jgi:hypothetical protein
MSTPERSQDPGRHGYGGTDQDYPPGDEHDDSTEAAEGDSADDSREAPDPQEPDEAI